MLNRSLFRVRAKTYFVLGAMILTLGFSSLYWFTHSQHVKKENDKLRDEMRVVLDRLSTVEDSMMSIKDYSSSLENLAKTDIKQIQNEVGIIDAAEEEAPALAEIKNSPNELNMDPIHISAPATTEQKVDNSTPNKNVTEFVDILDRVNDITMGASLLARRMQSLTTTMESRTELLKAVPNLLPTDGYISSGFGFRISPFTGEKVVHRGLDIAALEGTAVKASAGGDVLYAGNSKGSFGKVVIINHGYGIISKYAHNSRVFVRQGQKVKKGMKIAAVGNTGRSTGPHLHYEIWINGQPVDPRSFLHDKVDLNAPVASLNPAKMEQIASDEGMTLSAGTLLAI